MMTAKTLFRCSLEEGVHMKKAAPLAWVVMTRCVGGGFAWICTYSGVVRLNLYTNEGKKRSGYSYECAGRVKLHGRGRRRTMEWVLGWREGGSVTYSVCWGVTGRRRGGIWTGCCVVWGRECYCCGNVYHMTFKLVLICKLKSIWTQFTCWLHSISDLAATRQVGWLGHSFTKTWFFLFFFFSKYELARNYLEKKKNTCHDHNGTHNAKMIDLGAMFLGKHIK